MSLVSPDPLTFLEELKEVKPGTYNRLLELAEDKSIPLQKIAAELHPILDMRENALLSLLKKISSDNGWRTKEKVVVGKDGIQLTGKALKESKKTGKNMFELTEQDVEFLEEFRKGNVPFEKAQRELAARAFAKILADPGSVQIKDWLQSELLLIKKDELIQKKEYLEKGMSRMFSGMILEVCPHCGEPLYQDGEIVEESKPKEQQDEVEVSDTE